MDYPAATVRFIAASSTLGLTVEPTVYPGGTKTAADAADAIGCDVAAIMKSLVFMADDLPVVVLMSGDLRVDLAKVSQELGGARMRRASLDEVRDHTGYAAGGTPPIAHTGDTTVLADVSLRRYEEIWAAAGTPTTVFPANREQLVQLAGARWVDVAE